MQVPFLDLRVQHEPLMTELVDAFRRVTETSAFAGGPFVARFEAEFAAFCGTRHALGVGSGTDAPELRPEQIEFVVKTLKDCLRD